MGCGGIETRLMEIMERMNREQFHFDILIHQSGGYYETKARQLGATIHHCGRLRNVPAFAWRFHQLLKQSPYDVVHCHVPSFAAVCLPIARQTGVPIRIAHFRNMHQWASGSVSDQLARFISRCLIRYSATDVIGISRAVLDHWRITLQPPSSTTPRPRTHCLHNAIDTTAFQTAPSPDATRRSLDIPTDAPVVLNVGRCHPIKNQQKVLNVAQRMREQSPGIRFLFAGDGPLAATLKSKAREMGIEPNTLFLGNRSDIPQLMLMADAMIFPSRSEGLGVVVAEAVAAGLPMVVSDLPAIREQLHHAGEAALLPPDAPDEQWEAALAHALQEPKHPEWLDQLDASPMALPSYMDKLFQLYRPPADTL